MALGIVFDIVGFEEYDGTHLSPMEARHGNPGLGNLSTGFGVDIRF